MHHHEERLIKPVKLILEDDDQNLDCQVSLTVISSIFESIPTLGFIVFRCSRRVQREKPIKFSDKCLTRYNLAVDRGL